MSSEDTRATFEALGTTAVVAVTAAGALERATAVVRQVVDSFDLACSRFRADSELSAVNASAGITVEVGSLLLDAVEAALRAARLTDGDVDPTVGQALIALGYDRDFAELDGVVSSTGPIRLAAVPGWRTVQLDRAISTIRLPRGVTLDLGATAKALAADRAAEAAADASGAGVLVSLGGDIATAGAAPPEGWPVRVTDDHRGGPEAPGQSIAISSGALATSSTAVRRWQTTDGPVHHLIDPASGRPVSSDWRTVSVTAATCLDANIATTAAIVRGRRALPWLESLGLPSRLVGEDGAVHHIAGWPEEGDDFPTALASLPGGVTA